MNHPAVYHRQFEGMEVSVGNRLEKRVVVIGAMAHL